MTFQAKLTTKLDKFSVDDTVIELSNSVDREELDNVVKNLLKHLKNPNQSEVEKKKFDFILGGRLLRTKVDEHVELYADELHAKEILNEKLVEIEYVLTLDSPKPLDTIEQNDWISCVDVGESYIIVGSYDCSINIYSLKDRKNILSIENAHTQPITDIKWLHRQEKQGKELLFISCGFDEVSVLWSFSMKKFKCEKLTTFKGHKRSVDCIDIQGDLMVTGSFDKTLKVWSALPDDIDTDLMQSDGQADGKNKRKKVMLDQDDSKITRGPTVTLTGHKDAVKGVKWLDNGYAADSLASCSIDGLVFIWDVESGNETRKFISAKPMLGIDHCKGTEMLVTASCDRHARLWDARGPNESKAAAVFTSHSGWVSCVAFTQRPDHFVSGGYDNLVKLWDLRSPKACLYDLIGHKDKVLDVNCKNSNCVVSGSADSTVRLFAT